MEQEGHRANGDILGIGGVVERGKGADVNCC
jgi:hypothetical protein